MAAFEIITDYLQKTKIELIQSYTSKGLRASGEFERELEIKVSDTGKTVHGQITSAGHAWFMEQGRKPNKKQTKGQIYFLSKVLDKWAEEKGITINSWLAARKIVMEGIKVPNSRNPGTVFTDVLNDKWEEDLIKRISTWYIREFQTTVVTDLKKLI